MRSIKSKFLFHSYKIDEFNYKMHPTLNNVVLLGTNQKIEWEIGINIRIPQYILKDKLYIGGMDITLDSDIPENDDETKKDNPVSDVNLKLGIVGIFSVEQGRFDKELEKQLVKIQIPTILFPYARGAITSFLSNAGLGSIILPLINVQEIARSLDFEIQVI